MATLNLQIGASGDDSDMQSITNDSGRNVTTSGLISTNRALLGPGSHGSNDEWTVAMRFTGVTIPQGATINSATLQMRGYSDYSAPGGRTIKFWVSAQAADNAGALSSTAGDLNTTARPRTTAALAWNQPNVTFNVWNTADVTSIVQEIVNRAGWASGNAIVIIVDTHEDTTTNEWQEYSSYDNGSTSAPKLDIDYSTGGGGGPVKKLALLGVG